MITRRQILMALGAGGLMAPIHCLGQQQKIWRVGFLYYGSPQSALDTGRYQAFLQGMREFGYVEGKSLVIEGRFADGQAERMPGLAAELVQLKVDVIVATGVPAYYALQRATTTIPIVITSTADPVGEGFAASLARPGGNITGLSTVATDVVAKHLELLMTAVPKLSRVAVLSNPANETHPARLKIIQATGQKLGVQVLPVTARTAEDIERGFTMMTRERGEAVIVLVDTFFLQQMRQITELAIKHRLPSIYGLLEYAEARGFMTYGQDVTDNFRRTAISVDKIFKGAKPGELPFEQPTRFYLVINRKTARALGLTIPQSLLISADKVIE